LGWTVNLGCRGRQLTEQGRLEIDRALVVDKVGFIAAKVDMLSYQMDFDITSRQGKVILNISTIAAEEFRPALRIMAEVYNAHLGMGHLVAIARAGQNLGNFRVPPGTVGIGTICSVSLNGVLLHANIATTSRFGGLLELEQGKPTRFTEIINYDGSSLDPLEIFIRSGMTSVLQAARKGCGVVGASFREVPAIALPEVHRLIKQSENIGLGGVIVLGSPDQPLLDIPVTVGRVGIIVYGGLNPIAAVAESGVDVVNAAMSTLCEFSLLKDYRSFI
jgi:HTH-type transcriptional regulator, global nitrogen regulator NrpRI